MRDREERQGNEKDKKKKNPQLKKKKKKVLQFVNRTVLNLRLHCSLIPNIMTFKILDESGFLEFSVSNVKYLTH